MSREEGHLAKGDLTAQGQGQPRSAAAGDPWPMSLSRAARRRLACDLELRQQTRSRGLDVPAAGGSASRRRRRLTITGAPCRCGSSSSSSCTSLTSSDDHSWPCNSRSWRVGSGSSWAASHRSIAPSFHTHHKSRKLFVKAYITASHLSLPCGHLRTALGRLALRYITEGDRHAS